MSFVSVVGKFIVWPVAMIWKMIAAVIPVFPYDYTFMILFKKIVCKAWK